MASYRTSLCNTSFTLNPKLLTWPEVMSAAVSIAPSNRRRTHSSTLNHFQCTDWFSDDSKYGSRKAQLHCCSNQSTRGVHNYVAAEPPEQQPEHRALAVQVTYMGGVHHYPSTKSPAERHRAGSAGHSVHAWGGGTQRSRRDGRGSDGPLPWKVRFIMELQKYLPNRSCGTHTAHRAGHSEHGGWQCAKCASATGG